MICSSLQASLFYSLKCHVWANIDHTHPLSLSPTLTHSFVIVSHQYSTCTLPAQACCHEGSSRKHTPWSPLVCLAAINLEGRKLFHRYSSLSSQRPGHFPPDTPKHTRCHEKQQEDDEGFLRFSGDTSNSRRPPNPSCAVETAISPPK